MLRPISLPYKFSDLEPVLSRLQVRAHFEDHYLRYVEATNKAIAQLGGQYVTDWLEDSADAVAVARAAIEIPDSPQAIRLRNSAFQVWNHELYFLSMGPARGTEPANGFGGILRHLDSGFLRRVGGPKGLLDRWGEASKAVFGSGYLRLWPDRIEPIVEGAFKTRSYGQGVAVGEPLPDLCPDERPLATMDCWEHAYYLDYGADRAEYAKMWLQHLARL